MGSLKLHSISPLITASSDITIPVPNWSSSRVNSLYQRVCSLVDTFDYIQGVISLDILESRNRNRTDWTLRVKDENTPNATVRSDDRSSHNVIFNEICEFLTKPIRYIKDKKRKTGIFIGFYYPQTPLELVEFDNFDMQEKLHFGIHLLREVLQLPLGTFPSIEDFTIEPVEDNSGFMNLIQHPVYPRKEAKTAYLGELLANIIENL